MAAAHHEIMSPMPNPMQDTVDRTTHASSADKSVAVVRYDRAGRWRLERADGTSAALRLATAVTEALILEAEGGTIHHGRHGGSQFDNKVRAQRA